MRAFCIGTHSLLLPPPVAIVTIDHKTVVVIHGCFSEWMCVNGKLVLFIFKWLT